MRVLVTGGNGFLGSALVLKLREAGHEVVVVSRHPDADDGVRGLRADLRDPAAMATVLRGVELDGVCHLAALTRVRDSFADPLGYYATNLAGTLNLLAALAPRVPRFVFASTCAVYGRVDHPATETDPPAPGNPYASSKLAAEQLVGYQAALGGLAAVTLRCFNTAGAVAGIHDPDLTRLIPKALAVAAGGEAWFGLNGDGSAVREFTHVEDLADAYVLALHAARPGQHDVFNIGSGQGVTLRQVLDAVQEITGRTLPIQRHPPQDEPTVLVADSTRARERLGWSPRRSSLERIVADAWAAVR